MAWRLALGQIISWGILYYAFTVMVGPMQAETGWSRPFLNSGLSLGLLAWGGCALPVGVWIQRRGGRAIMTVSSLLGSIGLAGLALTTHPTAYLVAWSILGAAMAGVLYEPAFAVVTAHFGSEYRRGITLVTLVGGLASTVFIPFSQIAVDRFGWREALLFLAIFQAAVCVPLYALGLPRFIKPVSANATRRSIERVRAFAAELRRDITNTRFLGLALWFTAHAAAFTGVIFQLVPMLEEAGVENATIMKAIALIGPMQVLGRVALATWGRNFATLSVGMWATATLAVSMIALGGFQQSFLGLACFAMLYGAGNGVMTILRGTAIAELFGRERYAELNGALSLPALVAKAVSPMVLAALWTWAGSSRAVIAGVLAILSVGFAGLLVAKVSSRSHARASQTQRAQPASQQKHFRP